MAKIYKITDRISVKIGGLMVKLSPLTFEQKAEIQALAVSGDFKKTLEAARLSVKYSVKEIDNLQDATGKPYVLEFDSSGLKDDCINDLLNLEENESLSMACLGLLRGIPDQFINPFTREKLEGVSIVKDGAGKKK